MAVGRLWVQNFWQLIKTHQTLESPETTFGIQKTKILVDYAHWRQNSSNNFAWTLGKRSWIDQLSNLRCYLPDMVVGFRDSQVDPVPDSIWAIGHLGNKNQCLEKKLLGCFSPKVITFGPHSQPSCQMTIYINNWDYFKRDNWPSSQELFDLRFKIKTPQECETALASQY